MDTPLMPDCVRPSWTSGLSGPEAVDNPYQAGAQLDDSLLEVLRRDQEYIQAFAELVPTLVSWRILCRQNHLHTYRGSPKPLPVAQELAETGGAEREVISGATRLSKAPPR